MPNAGLSTDYQKKLLRLTDSMNFSLLYWIRANYRAREDEIAMDASPVNELLKTMRKLFRKWIKKFDELAEPLAQNFVEDIDDAAKRKLTLSLREAGVSISFNNPHDVQSKLRAMIAENVALIKSIPRQHLSRVETIVLQSVSNGRDVSHVVEALENSFKVPRNRAIFIAKDQINKVTEAVSLSRCNQIGITEGVWLHRSGSKKPRQHHVEMHNETFKLSEGMYDPVVRRFVKPGEEPNCHCTFKPLLPQLGK
jgi:Uncharacterized protein, homolog of phage Mu protein gp30